MQWWSDYLDEVQK